MALHPDFPTSPHHILDPEVRWFPADEALRETTMDKLMPPPGGAVAAQGEGVPRQRLRGGEQDEPEPACLVVRRTAPATRKGHHHG
uniref:Uncharacterized protein n=1 Tax=Candidatus Kentrum sp. LFY TaxID=2126342 RepID=A0A450V6L1_9GAMM|nr:MAG: hypothetical protein BECKLFY1418A_GA0070994_11166 [Candidatus Kentron sp. LFY]